MKMTLESTIYEPRSEACITVDSDELTISQVFDMLVKPLLIAYGYQQESVDEYLGDE